MRIPIALTAITLLLLMPSPAVAANDIFTGVWGGKWNDVWPVFLTISAEPDGNYMVIYNWLEDENGKEFLGGRKQLGTLKGRYLQTKRMLFMPQGDRSILYGDFGRMANLVRIESGEIPTTEDADSTLRSNGWRKGKISADDARKQILGE